MQKSLTQTFFLSASETNAEAELSLPLLTTKIIDISTAHANILGIGNQAMESRGCGWVLSRLALEMQRYPKVNETYSLTTWIESWNRHFSERIVRIDDSEGNAVGYSRAIWMVLDTTSRESVGLSILNIPDGLSMPGECPIARQGKHRPVAPSDYTGELTAGAVRATNPPFEYLFKYCDLDFYRHVNTVRYIALLLNRFSLDEWDKMEVARMELAFMHESRYGRRVTVLRADEDLKSQFSLTDEDGTPLMFASITRRERK